MNNRLLLFSTLGLFLLTIGSWKFLQSETMGGLLSGRVNQYLAKKHNIEVSFQNIKISLIPLRTTLVNVDFKNKDANIKVSQLFFQVGVKDFLSNELSIGEVGLSEGVVEYFRYKKHQEDKEVMSYSDLYEFVRTTMKKELPLKIRSLSLRHIDLFVQGNHYKLGHHHIQLKKQGFYIVGRNILNRKILKDIWPGSLHSIDIDGVEYRVLLKKNEVDIEYLKVLRENDYVKILGVVKSDLTFSDLSFESSLSSQYYSKTISGMLGEDDIRFKGTLLSKGQLSYLDESLQGNVELSALSFRNKFVDINNTVAKVSILDKKITVEDAIGQIGSGRFKLEKPSELFDFNDKKIDIDLTLSGERIFSQRVFKAVPALEDLDFLYDGDLNLRFLRDRVSILFLNDGLAKNVSFGANRKKPIFSLKEGRIKKDSRLTARYNGDLRLSMRVITPESNIGVLGKIKNEKISIQYKGKISLSELEKISGVEVAGSGDIVGQVRGSVKQSVFDFNYRGIKNNILGFDLGTATGHFKYHIRDRKLAIRSLRRSEDNIKYLLHGDFLFGDSEYFKINIKNLSGRYFAVEKLLFPILHPMQKYKEKIELFSNFKGNAVVEGKYDIDSIKGQGLLRLSELSIKGEDFDYVKTPFIYAERKLNLKALKGKKSSGIIDGSASLDFVEDLYSYNINIDKLKIRDIYYYRLANLGLDGIVSFKGEGQRNKESFVSKNLVRLKKSRVGNVSLNDSIATVHNNNENLFFDMNLLGDEFRFSGFVNLNEKGKKTSVAYKVNSNNLGLYTGILSAHNVKKSNIKGSIRGEGEVKFNLFDIRGLDLKSKIDKFNFSYKNLGVSNINKPITLEVKNGLVENWDVSVVGVGLEVKSKAKGRLKKDFTLETSLSLDATFAELISDKIEKSSGVVKSRFNIVSERDDFSSKMSYRGRDLRVKIEGLRGTVSDINLNGTWKDNGILLEGMKAKYGNGEIRASGKVGFLFPSPFPQVSFTTDLQRVEMPILKKSNVTVSGRLNLSGNKFPYLVGGDIIIEDGNVIEGMQDLAESASSAEGYKRFLPIRYSRGGVSPLALKINTRIRSPIVIKNGMLDFGLVGNVNIIGTPTSPMFNGTLSVAGRDSKLVFKGHEFFLRSGEVRLLDKRSKEKPEVNFLGMARVNEYSIFVNIAGSVDNLAVELNSSPPLSQEDIVSLLTLGVTSDVSKNLNESEIQSVTNLSIGSLIVDQLKINQTLNDSLGLRLSVQPEFQQNENNLLVGRSEDSGGESNLRSTTRVKVHKKISKKVNMSISSTLGGTVDQSQEMNINYKVNRNFSLEGVYQIQTSDELDTQTPDSVGADLKWHWSF